VRISADLLLLHGLAMPFTVTVPATTANIGPGFDCIGAALSLFNRFHFSPLPDLAQPLQIEATGAEADRVQCSADNLAYRAFLRLYQQIQQPAPPIHLHIELAVPLARGLGSSATAIVGGLVGANAIAGSPLNQMELAALAIDLEGHPDNVVPALIGGCRLAATQADSTWTICEIPWHQDVVPVVVIPDFELSTAKARQVLPATYSRQDAIFNTAHLGLLVRALQTGEAAWLKTALQDRIHQPYRQSLISGYAAVEQAALAAGAYGLVISGAGPTLLALAHSSAAPMVKAAMAQAWKEVGVTATAHILPIAAAGTVVEKN
jgi:homoserine kinase